ncbi:outer membrane lipid asymmetry maintenance protein MlaD [Pelagicoccus sp. SDUM812005]|uniref:outer membrane lipid asymmetry maintenance protein MlaD n=1 Tax=Pelagicoccus sp. SDUM812005 TaxID=3041257 RepID=UPI00280EF9CB|nr:outer membrane lipid asymmetry maintenance protein MlaD [Pelagicoccus sp. SDUM812005]MDQ8182521.1 outer membrane lipid asymmetry maintenance protein MlaD [Pelagicoccus sp. SDUM812005]
MNSKKIDFSVGLFVLVGISAIVYMAIQIGGGRFFGNDSQNVTAIFSNIGGLSSGSNITIAGVKIGTVGPITLNAETLKAEVTLLIDKDIQLWDDATAAIKTNGLIGDKYISIYPGTEIEGISMELSGPIVDTEPAIDIEGLISRFAFGSVTEEK